MNLIVKIAQKLKKHFEHIFYHTCLVWDLLYHHAPKNAYIFGAPLQRNMGDQAQSYCIEKWIIENYPEHKIHIIVIPHTTDKIIKIIKRLLSINDLIFFHSGYHLTDLYSVRYIYCKCIREFKDHKIMAFPQTVNFYDIEKLKETAQIYSSHPNMTLLCRDEKSFSIAQKYFKVKRLLLFPDIVTTLIGCYNYQSYRDGVLFCIRNDIEAFYKKNEIDSIKNKFTCRTEITDTTIETNPIRIVRNRKKIIEDIIKYFSSFKVIITDRYHGTIFSLVSNTPVIVISSTDHKLSSGVKWFPKDIFGNYIYYANNLDEAYNLALKKINEESSNILLPQYFKDNYYSNLKSIFDE